MKVMMNRPDAPATKRNRDPILKALKKELYGAKELLEIGSGTGQHAVYFAKHMPMIVWQTSDQEKNHDAIQSWIMSTNSANLKLPLNLEIGLNEDCIKKKYDDVFSSNTSHIMSFNNVEKMFSLVGRILRKNGKFFLYGPFRVNGDFTSKSNEKFNDELNQKDPIMGIRDIEKLDKFAIQNNLSNYAFLQMPANNFLSVWSKI